MQIYLPKNNNAVFITNTDMCENIGRPVAHTSYLLMFWVACKDSTTVIQARLMDQSHSCIKQ